MQLNKNQECMHDREFEKQVQQKMQELRLQPGADVWARVQADVQKKRRRRPVIVWVLFAGLMIGSAWILYSNYGNNKQLQTGKENSSSSDPDKSNGITNSGNADKPTDPLVTKQPDNTTPQTNNNTNDNNTRNSNNTTPDKVNNKPGVNNLPDKNIAVKKLSTPAETRDVARTVNPKNRQATEKPAGHSKGDRQPVESAITKNDQQLPTNQPKKNNQSTDVAKTDNSKTDATKTDPTKSDATKTDPSKTDVSKTDVAKTDNTKTDQQKTDPSKTDISKPDQSKSDLTKTDQPRTNQPTTDPSKTKTQVNAKWQYGISAGAGVSSLAMKLFQSTSVADYAFNRNFGGIVLNSPTGPSPSTVPRPSEVTSGGAFNFGGYVSKKMSNRLRLKLGLNYEYYSNNIKTGSFVDSTKSINQGATMDIVSMYYEAGNTNTYTNKYHYISLPVSIQWRLNKNPKYGIVWENGVSIAQLLSSNALHFDGISGSYYKDNSLLQKTQLLIGSSLLFEVKMKNNNQFYVGPHVQYGLTNMVKYDENKARHMRYAGVKLMLGFNKN
ncbi:MAG TPA: hypothetical protein VFZ47_05830 [Chitinophagaceae bacterium]